MTGHRFIVQIVLTCLAFSADAGLAMGAAPVTVAWRDKPPYHYLEGGVEKGMLLLRARQVFAAAGIEAQFVREPSKRIWANFQAGASNYCSFGWYRLEEREQFATFTRPLHTDLPHVVLVAPASATQVGKHTRLASLLADRSLVLGVVDGVSYGKELDGMIKASANQVLRRTVDPVTMMRMTAAGRVAFMLLDVQDWEYARVREPELKGMDARAFPDMPAGQQRYIVCSKDVAAALIARLNDAIAHLPAPD